jgi:transposase
MAVVAMSERELKRISVLAEVGVGSLGPGAAAAILGVSRRQLFRLLARYRDQGAIGLAHRARGRASNNKLSDGVRHDVMALVVAHYRDFGPSFACEMLEARHGLEVSRETLRGWMIAAGIWLTKRQKKRVHQLRLRRPCMGELIQIDGSDHAWFEDRGPKCTLIVFIDDATSRLMGLRFVRDETTFAYFDVLSDYVQAYGRPVAFYSDRHSIFKVSRPSAHQTGLTQFGRALNELNIDIICADTSEAKGRVERANRTLQDRLIKEMRLDGICDMAGGNAWLPSFIERFNKRFAVLPAEPIDRHRPLTITSEQLARILCLRDKRKVGQSLVLSHENRRVILEPTTAAGLAGEWVDTFVFADGRLELAHKGVPLPYRAFDKNAQRVTQGDVVSSKRLGTALDFIRQAQESGRPVVEVMARSERNAYRHKKALKQVGGPPNAAMLDVYAPVGPPRSAVSTLLQR